MLTQDEKIRTSVNAVVPPGDPILGHLPALWKDPLGFLSQCASGDERIVSVRLPFIHAVLLMEPGDIEQVLVTDHRGFVKPVWLRTPSVRRLLGDGLVTSDGEVWRRQRKMCHPAFRPDRMDGYGAAMAGLTERTLSTWSAGQSRNISHDMTALTLEIVAQTMFEVALGERCGEIGKAMDVLMECFGAPRSFFGLLPLPPTRREREASRDFDRLVDSLIAEGRHRGSAESRAGACPIQHSLLEMVDESEQSDPKAMRDQVKTFLAAGHESSALTLTWAFLLLARNPDADARLAAELSDVLEDRPLSPEELPRLRYTQAVVKEALRLYPPLWMSGRRAVRNCEIGGCRVAKGTLVLTSQWAVQRSARHFASPDAFRPERWISSETADLPRFAYFPFGGGPRVCIGQNFAMVEATLLLAAIARRFRLELDGDQDIRPWPTMTLRPPSNIKMRLVTRERG